MEPTLPDFLPALRTTAPPRAKAAAAYPENSSKEVVDMRPNLLDYAGGEVGFVYGRSTGKFSGDFEAGYITGWAGNDKFQISAGASYENSSVRFSRH
jgi:hypothetical protein